MFTGLGLNYIFMQIFPAAAPRSTLLASWGTQLLRHQKEQRNKRKSKPAATKYTGELHTILKHQHSIYAQTFVSSL